ncbi:unnamed protein product [Symbiodinium natans]|uniref:Uncharacterized protein n=1 Tax=Symbiodinium natans TaxID=878477 RepID=A0A812SAT7_9DINO|nr:unnamed protein product [Symbiodinium natans]
MAAARLGKASLRLAGACGSLAVACASYLTNSEASSGIPVQHLTSTPGDSLPPRAAAVLLDGRRHGFSSLADLRSLCDRIDIDGWVRRVPQAVGLRCSRV